MTARRPVTRAEVEAAAITSARLHGCRCPRPTVDIDNPAPGVWSATVEHDAGCDLPDRATAHLN